MSLEAALKELNETNLKLLDATLRLIDLREKAVETVKETAAPAPKETKETKTTKTLADTAKEVGAAVDPAKAEEDRQAELKAAAEAHPVGKLVLQYVGSGYDEAHEKASEERAARSAKVKALYGSIGEQLKITVESYKDIPEKYHAKVVEKLTAWIEEGNLVIKEDAELAL